MSGLKTFLPGLAESAIDLAAVTDIVDRDLQSGRIHFIHDPVVTDSNSIEPFSALQLGRLARKGIALKLIEAVKDAGDEWLGQGVNPEYSWRFVAKSCRRQAKRARGATKDRGVLFWSTLRD